MMYKCQRCGDCCRWPGQVKVTDAEIAAIAGHLGMTIEAFIDLYTRLGADRRGLSLMEKETGECVFLDGVDCRIQAVKPRQCRDFPSGWQNPQTDRQCPNDDLLQQ
jgi:hypothetical protein